MTDDYFSHPVRKDGQELEAVTTFPEFLSLLQREYGSDPAVSSEGSLLTYGELIGRVARRVTMLETLEIPAGAILAVLCPNDINAMELLLAIPAAGYTVLMLPCTLPPLALREAAAKFDIACIFAAEEYLSAAAETGVPALAADAIGQMPSAFPVIARETPAAVFLTGGTGGELKGAVLSQGALMRGAYLGIFTPGIIQHSTTIAMLPFSHIYGAVGGFLSNLYLGSLIHPCTEIRQTIREIPTLRPRHLAVVPGLLELLLNMAELKGPGFLDGFALAVCGAAALQPKETERCRRSGIAVYTGYGMTECCPVAVNADTERFPDSVGRLYPGVEAKLEDGELWVRSDNVMCTYYRDPLQTDRALCGGWLRTGDLAEFREHDGQPYLYITGRIKNLIILGNGENVSPEELEALLLACDEVEDCLVRETTAGGNAVIGAEVLPCRKAFEGASADEVEERLRRILAEVNSSLPSYKQIRKLTVRQEDFDRSAAMKKIRRSN